MIKKKIKQSVVAEIENQARTAKSLLEDKQFSFIIDYLSSQTKEIERVILNNTIRDSYKEGILGGIKQTFFTPKKEQIAEHSGKYKAITDFMRFLQSKIDTNKELQESIQKGGVIVNENE